MLRLDGWRRMRERVEERIIKTKRGLYGRVNITLPLPVNTSLLDLQKKSGLKKAEFLRIVLMMGTEELSENALLNDHKGTSGELSKQPFRT
jgi:hypothetical protein